MVFAGMQKMSLLDYPGLVCCTLFTPGCNFRCPFCHNSDIVRNLSDQHFPQEEILSYLQKRKGLLDGVTVTGGEPLLHKDLPDFLARVKDLGYCVKLDTNGAFPQALAQVVSRGLVDKVAMDIKNSPEAYPATVGIPAFDISPIRESVAFLMEEPVDYEFRTTVVQGLHTRKSLSEAAQWIAGAKNYFLQGFVDSGNLLAPAGLQAFSPAQMQEFLTVVKEYVPNAALRGI